MTLGNLLYSASPSLRFSHLLNEGNNGISLIGVVWELTGLINKPNTGFFFSIFFIIIIFIITIVINTYAQGTTLGLYPWLSPGMGSNEATRAPWFEECPLTWQWCGKWVVWIKANKRGLKLKTLNVTCKPLPTITKARGQRTFYRGEDGKYFVSYGCTVSIGGGKPVVECKQQQTICKWTGMAVPLIDQWWHLDSFNSYVIKWSSFSKCEKVFNHENCENHS